MDFLKLFVIPLCILLIAGASAFGHCPSIAVIGPPGLRDWGSKVIFRVEGGKEDWKYLWSVSGGAIVDGQGTPVITVSTDVSLAGRNLEAKVEIGGLPQNCPSTASGAAPIAPIRDWEVVDEWGNLKNDDQRGRLDAFFAELSNNPHSTGLIIVYVWGKERFDSKNRKVQLYLDHIKFRKFDLSRIWFSLERSTIQEPRTKLYWFPPELADMIPCDKCLIIKGGDLR